MPHLLMYIMKYMQLQEDYMSWLHLSMLYMMFLKLYIHHYNSWLLAQLHKLLDSIHIKYMIQHYLNQLFINIHLNILILF